MDASTRHGSARIAGSKSPPLLEVATLYIFENGLCELEALGRKIEIIRQDHQLPDRMVNKLGIEGQKTLSRATTCSGKWLRGRINSGR